MKLIDKDALVVEIDNLLDKGKYHEEYDCAYRDGNNGALYALKGKLDTLEVKEVDLEKEIQDHIKECLDIKFPTTSVELIKEDVAYTARKFFKLGFKAQKGEKV